MAKLRVAIVAPSLEIPGGQSIQAARLVGAWRADPDVEAWLVPVNPAPLRPFSLARKIKYLRTVVTELTYLPLLVRDLARADVAHVFSASYTSFLLAPLPALIVARMLGRPAILNYRSGQAPDHLKRSRLARAAIGRTDRTIVPSGFLVDVFASFGIEATVVPNLVDLERFRFRERDPVRPVLLSARSFEPLYNVACTLRAFQRIQREKPSARLTLVGGGTLEASLKALAGDLGLRHVTFAGPVPHAEMASWYAGHDIYIQSPNIDNAPTSVLEAFASGLPVVSSAAGGVPALLTHGQHGLLAPVGDHDALADHVLHLLDSPDFARRLARQANATCGRHAWASVRAEWLRAYRSLAPAANPYASGPEMAEP
jgi:glycosyltransferase involved in cell wall biosynthesis